MFVVVAVTIFAPLSVSTTWTLSPTIVAPVAGSAISTVASDDGRGPSVGELAGVSVTGGAVAAGVEQAATPRTTVVKAASSAGARWDWVIMRDLELMTV